MSHRRRPLAVLAIVVSLLLAGAPITSAVPERDPAGLSVVEHVLGWLGGWGNVLARAFDADEAAPPSEPEFAAPVPAAGPLPSVQTSPIENESGPDADPDG